MKTKVSLSFILAAFITLSSQAQEKQKRLGIEFSPGVSMATQKLGGSTLNPGFGFEGIFHYRFMPHLGAYGGWGWNRFGAEESFAGDDVSFEETGYVLGLQYKRPFGESKLSWYLRVGGLYAHIETENSDGDVFNDTGHGLGWQFAGGLELGLGNNWSLTPGIKFNALSRESDFDSVTRQMDHNYVSLRMGLVKKF